MPFVPDEPFEARAGVFRESELLRLFPPTLSLGEEDDGRDEVVADLADSGC